MGGEESDTRIVGKGAEDLQSCSSADALPAFYLALAHAGDPFLFRRHTTTHR